MKLFFSLLKQQSLLLVMTAVSFSMDEPKGILDNLLLHKYTNERKIIFGSLLQPKEINVLRKTSKQLSMFFSYCEPSLDFMVCNNPYVCKRDYKSILFAALYDSNYEIAEILSSRKIFNNRYRIPGSNYAVYPNKIIGRNNEKMRSLKQHFAMLRYMGDPNICTINPFLIACISRNNKRVEEALINFPESTPDDNSLLHGFSVVINNNDIQSLNLFIKYPTTRSYIEKNGSSLIINAMFCGSMPSFKSLIASNLCDINQQIIQAMATMEDFVVMNPEIETVVVRTIQDVFMGEKNLLDAKYGNKFVTEIEEILLKNGAKTVKDLVKNEQVKNSRRKKLFSKIRL